MVDRVYWKALLSNGEAYGGTTSDGSWRELRRLLSNDLNQYKIVSCRIYNDQGVASTDQNKDGYFLGNQLLAIIDNGTQENFVGLGYWGKNDNKCRILWYNAKTLVLSRNEVRDGEKAGFFLIKNSTNEST